MAKIRIPSNERRAFGRIEAGELKVLNEVGEIVDLPAGQYHPVGGKTFVEPNEDAAFQSRVDYIRGEREQRGFWGYAPGPCGYYTAYYWSGGEDGQPFFPLGSVHAASHMRDPVGREKALKVAAAFKAAHINDRQTKGLQYSSLTDDDLLKVAEETLAV